MRINVNLSDDLHDWLDERSKKIGIPKSTIVAVLIQENREYLTNTRIEKYLRDISRLEILKYHPDVKELEELLGSLKKDCEKECDIKFLGKK